MEMSNAAIGAIAALSVTAGAAGVYVTSAGVPAMPVTPVETIVTAAAPQPAPVYQAPPVAPVPVARMPVARATRYTAPAVRVERQQTFSSETRSARVPEPETERDEDTLTVWSPIEEPSRPRIDPPLAANPDFIELTVPADSVVGLQIESALSSETAELEDDVVARVTRDVRIDDRVAIPAGAQVQGVVTLVERGGKMRERARLGVRFTSVVFADGTRIPLATDTIIREGSSPGGESAAKIGGGAIGGAIIGGIMGGARGAMIGGSVGAGAGTAAVMVGGRNPATFPAGTAVTARLTEPTTVTAEF
jgi:type IV secretory pathway VirB10-like protein